MIKNLFKVLFFLACLHSISCWPNYFLFTGNNKDIHNLITAENISNSNYDFSKETKFIIHGFADDGNNWRMAKIKDALLQKDDFNVIIVDWGKGSAAPNYFAAKDNAKVCGTRVGSFIQQTGIRANSTHCIGHSLGAHACGFAGKVIKLNRITGMDPAGPLFKGNAKEHRLDKSDAYFVDNIHTDWILGIQDSIGHMDFYPNGGKLQPGCGISKGYTYSSNMQEKFYNLKDIGDLFACSHVKVTYYYAESVNSNCKFTATPCKSWDDFKEGNCKCDSQKGCASMGYAADQNNLEGKFYLDVNKSDPYCLN